MKIISIVILILIASVSASGDEVPSEVNKTCKKAFPMFCMPGAAMCEVKCNEWMPNSFSFCLAFAACLCTNVHCDTS
ncbi:hypothetical protein Hanom_Chr09g00790191 [Helianthus anomalus]